MVCRKLRFSTLPTTSWLRIFHPFFQVLRTLWLNYIYSIIFSLHMGHLNYLLAFPGWIYRIKRFILIWSIWLPSFGSPVLGGLIPFPVTSPKLINSFPIRNNFFLSLFILAKTSFVHTCIFLVLSRQVLNYYFNITVQYYINIMENTQVTAVLSTNK